MTTHIDQVWYVEEPPAYPRLGKKELLDLGVEMCVQSQEVHNSVFKFMLLAMFTEFLINIGRKVEESYGTNNAVQVHIDGNLGNEDHDNICLMHICDIFALRMLKHFLPPLLSLRGRLLLR